MELIAGWIDQGVQATKQHDETAIERIVGEVREPVAAFPLRPRFPQRRVRNGTLSEHPGRSASAPNLSRSREASVAGVSPGFGVARYFSLPAPLPRNAGRDEQREEPPCPNPSC
jgi:hypothetical protein